ncbi:MAG: hypothetical protein ACREYC_15505 [Gammaproteobacteria bacterium]
MNRIAIPTADQTLAACLPLLAAVQRLARRRVKHQTDTWRQS